MLARTGRVTRELRESGLAAPMWNFAYTANRGDSPFDFNEEQPARSRHSCRVVDDRNFVALTEIDEIRRHKRGVRQSDKVQRTQQIVVLDGSREYIGSSIEGPK